MSLTKYLSTRAAVLCLVLSSCGEDDPKVEDMCDDSALTYAVFGKPFMDSYCAGCHAATVSEGDRQGAPVSEVFDTIEQIRAAHVRLNQVVAVDRIMPFGSSSPKPTEAQRQQFGAWLQCGAP